MNASLFFTLDGPCTIYPNDVGFFPIERLTAKGLTRRKKKPERYYEASKISGERRKVLKPSDHICSASNNLEEKSADFIRRAICSKMSLSVFIKNNRNTIPKFLRKT